MKEGRN